MKKNILFLSSIGFMLLFSSCATILSTSNYPVTINSIPSEAKITVTNRANINIYKGTTPASMILKSSAGYFKKESYKVDFTDYNIIVPLECTLDNYYWGNILLGGLLGMLIIDPISGAMYSLQTTSVNQTLPDQGIKENNEPVLEDVVYLNNGGIIHGTIIEQIPNKSIKIQTADGNVFVFKIDEINKFTKEEIKR